MKWEKVGLWNFPQFFVFPAGHVASGTRRLEKNGMAIKIFATKS